MTDPHPASIYALEAEKARAAGLKVVAYSYDPETGESIVVPEHSDQPWGTRP